MWWVFLLQSTGSMFVQSPPIYLSNYTALHPRRPSSPLSPWTPQMSLSVLFCFTHTEKLFNPKTGAPCSCETLYPHIELPGISHLQTSSHSNPLSPLCCCTPACRRLDSPAKHSCRRSGRPNAAKRCGARRKEASAQDLFYTRQNVLTSWQC
jgi:hypothetical protein